MRILRSGNLRGSRRLVRHLWRMCFALFIATASFFLGQAKVFPQPIRIPALLALPVVAVLVTMLYWLWRVRTRRALRSFGGVGAAGPVMRTPGDGSLVRS
jgi:heme/copper-type cytochrome/quinol oxidase subunit 4